MQFAAMTGRLRIGITEELASSPDTLIPTLESARPLNGCFRPAAQWLATKVAERYEAEQQVLERIERIMELL
jgi:hypothetical protein